YIDFAPDKSFLSELNRYQNLVILQTFSKAWGMAGIRLGMAFASTEIVDVLNKIKYPYNINILTQQKALELLEQKDKVGNWVKLIIAEREKMAELLKEFPFVVKIYPSDANFLLVKMHDAKGIYDYLVEKGIIVRDRSNVHLCENSLRITIGSPKENNLLITVMENLI
ncbi:MAG: aminotransferase class I/II-fold pyridoxal phosphate-dependent enzyme, partial [Draconibacterium sp.]|nr:aminotransferase class I/II-fold pyridoxal phosphate-dependent enzyme [Draconibacterium sp.]